MFDKIKEFVKNWNVSGIGLPTMKDPLTNKGSITASLVVVSCASVLISLVTKKVDNAGAFEFYLGSLAAYLGRNYQKGNISSTEKPNDKL